MMAMRKFTALSFLRLAWSSTRVLRVDLRHSREITRFCSPQVPHHCTRMVQFARVQNRVRSAAKALPCQALPLLAVARFHHATGIRLETQPVTGPSARMMENQTARFARMISLALSLAQRQIVFFAWVS